MIRLAATCGLALALMTAAAGAQEAIEVTPLEPPADSEALGEQGPEIAQQIHVSQGVAGRLRVLDKITGVVTDITGTAYLEGAVVTIDRTNRATTTDRRGEFDFGAK